jgi:hypothetical protein
MLSHSDGRSHAATIKLAEDRCQNRAEVEAK